MYSRSGSLSNDHSALKYKGGNYKSEVMHLFPLFFKPKAHYLRPPPATWPPGRAFSAAWAAVWRRGEGGAEKQWKLATAVELRGNKMGDTNVYLIVVKGTFRFRLKISTSMEISEITMLTFTLNWYYHRFEHDACLLSCCQRKRCHVEQCQAVYLNRLLSLCWKCTLM